MAASENGSSDTPAAGRVPVLLLTAPLPEERGPSFRISQAWMVTFTDLVALLITFFVMLFAMSQVEERKWQNLTDALANNLDAVREVTVALPADEPDLEAVEPVPGVDLDYLATLLRQHMADEPSLDGGIVTRLADRLVISLPSDLLFAPGQVGLAEAGERATYALGGLLRNVNNRIEVAGHADPRAPRGRFVSNWELSLVRALAVAEMLRRAGYKGEVTTRGHGDSRFATLSPELGTARRQRLARRVDVIVHDDAGELEP